MSLWTAIIDAAIEGQYLQFIDNQPRELEWVGIDYSAAEEGKYADKDGNRWLFTFIDKKTNENKEHTTTSNKLARALKKVGADEHDVLEITKIPEGQYFNYSVKMVRKAGEEIAF